MSRLSSGTGGSMKNISKSKLEAMLVPDVSIDKQRAFAERALLVQKHDEQATASLIEIDALFASLQARAFRGEL